MQARATVLLADDHQIMIEGLKRLLTDDYDVVGTVEDGHALISAARELKPDIIVADITMPRLNGIEALAQLKKDKSDVKLIFLTMHQDILYARRAIEMGAAGYVVKHSASVELILAIRAALQGQVFISPALNEPATTKVLTSRQREILRLLAEGRSAKEIAASLAISHRTVEFHKYQLMDKHGLHNNAELIQFAIKQGIVTI